MAIDHDIDVVADGFTHLGYARLCHLNRLESLNWHGRGYGHRLKRRETFGHSLPRELAELSRVVDRCFVKVFHLPAAQMTVHPYVVADRTTPKFVTGHSMQLTK